MSSFKNVFDVMKGVSSKNSHTEIFRKLIGGEGENEMVLIDMLGDEAKMLSTTERNILSGIECQDKFTRNGMDEHGIMIDVTAVAKSGSAIGRNELIHSKQVNLSFKPGPEWTLAHDSAVVHYSDRSATMLAKDDGILTRIKASCPNLSDGQIGDLSITYAAEKMTRKPNMEHILTKMYLMLQDLNLSATSKSESRRVSQRVMAKLVENIDGGQRLGRIVRNDIVIDAEGFTLEELELLTVASEPYPAVKFGRDNVYNCCHLAKDDLVIISDGKIEGFEVNMRWVPDSLYRLIVSLVCKLDCVEDWWKVTASMRGRMHLMRDVMKFTQDRRVNTGMPRSFSAVRALGGTTDWNKAPKRLPGFLSASVALISDALLGESLLLGATCVVEQMGGIGQLTCKGHPATDSLYASVLRDFGISTMSIEKNTLLTMWTQISGADYNWGIPRGYSDFLIGLTQQMRTGWDVPIPQLAHDTPYVVTEHSAWGVLRGWTGQDGFTVEMLGEERDKRHKVRAAFTWAMGVRAVRPKVFANNAKRGEDTISVNEHKWLSGTEGLMKMTKVTYTLAESVGGRVDHCELEATALLRTAIKGTRCSVLYVVGKGWEVDERQYTDTWQGGVEESMGFVQNVREFTRGFADDEDDTIEPITIGGSKIIENDKNVFGTLSATVRPRPVTISLRSDEMRNEKVEYRDGTIGYPAEGQYSRSLVAGDEVTYKQVSVPGDGKCGLHSLAKGMEMRGMMKSSDLPKVLGNFDNMSNQTVWHDIQDIGAIALEYGMRVRLFDENQDGLILHEYGVAGQPTVDISRSGGHYTPIVLGVGHERHRINSVQEFTAKPEEGLASIKEFQKFFRVR